MAVHIMIRVAMKRVDFMYLMVYNDPEFDEGYNTPQISDKMVFFY